MIFNNLKSLKCFYVFDFFSNFKLPLQLVLAAVFLYFYVREKEMNIVISNSRFATQ